MHKQFISINELPVFLIKQLRKTKEKSERIEIIKNFIYAIIKRKQVLGSLFKNFEKVFCVKASNEIKRYLLSLKDSYDKNEEIEEFIVNNIALFVLQNSYLCDNKTIYAKLPEKIDTLL